MRSISRQERQVVTAILAAVVVLWPSISFLADEPPGDDALRLAPLPEEVPAPDDNPTTAEKTELGKQLFSIRACPATTP